VIHYHEILLPSKSATLLPQGQIGGCSGAIRQVLPVFDQLLTHLEEQRYTHRPIGLQSMDQALEYLTAEHYFSTNINLGWQKLDEYYTRLDQSPIFCAAVVLHPHQKWLWFEKHWIGRQDWIDQAKVTIEQLWRRYKYDELSDDRPAPSKRASTQIDEWSDDDEDLRASVDQLA
jgi:hypothetical protein